MRFPTSPLAELASTDRVETEVDTGLTYDGITPVVVRVTKRDGRYKVSEGGGATRAAGVRARRVAFPEQIVLGEHSVNVTGQGVVWLPAVAPTETWLETICSLVSRGSIELYERLLELDSDT